MQLCSLCQKLQDVQAKIPKRSVVGSDLAGCAPKKLAPNMSSMRRISNR